MSSHTEADSPPPFRFRIVKQFKDCLSRQVGEAIAILLSKDKPLNSKSELHNKNHSSEGPLCKGNKDTYRRGTEGKDQNFQSKGLDEAVPSETSEGF